MTLLSTMPAEPESAEQQPERQYTVQLTQFIDARSPNQAVLQAAANVDDGGGYRMGWYVVDDRTKEEFFIDAETITEGLDEV